jgi:hypothetical protein
MTVNTLDARAPMLRTSHSANPAAGIASIGGPDFGILVLCPALLANSTENIASALDRIGDFLASREPV